MPTVLETGPRRQSIFVQNVTEVVPPFDHIDGHRTKQLSHFAEMAENEIVA
jgi:hypothetical protein